MSQLRTAEREKTLRSIALALPLIAYILVIFVLPLGLLLFRAVYDPTISELLPRTTAALQSWDGQSLPPNATYDDLALDLKAAYDNQAAGKVAQRINFDLPGSRSVIVSTARQIEHVIGPDAKQQMIEINLLWGDPNAWKIIKRAGSAFTASYLLKAFDLKQSPDGAIAALPNQESVYRDVLLRTLWISTIVTALTLILAYPFAFLITSVSAPVRNLLLIIVLLPFFTSLLVRTTAWVVLLQSDGVVNQLLTKLGLISQPLQLIYQRSGTIIAMTHIQLPFTLLPIYSVMAGIDPRYYRAARTLGASPFTAFRRVYAPLTLPGVGAGCLLTFILCLGYYITPALVGGPTDQLVSSFVADFMNKDVNWGMASALSVVLLATTLVVYAIYVRLLGIEKVGSR